MRREDAEALVAAIVTMRKNATDEQKAELLKKALDNAYKQVNNVWKEKLGAYDK